jgi:N-acetylglucosamine kinase-like BadF-type ATPase
MTAFDHGRPDVLGNLACKHLGCVSLRALQQALGRGDIDRARFASLAVPILGLAERVSEAALLRDEGAAALLTLVRIADERLAPSPQRRVSWIGGMFKDEGFRAAFIRVCNRVPRLRVAPPKHDPATAALVLAARDVSA